MGGGGYGTKRNSKLLQTLKSWWSSHKQKRLHLTILNPTKKSQLCGKRDYGMFSKLPCEGRSSLSLEAFKQK